MADARSSTIKTPIAQIRAVMDGATKREQEWRDIRNAGLMGTESRQRYEDARRTLIANAPTYLAALLNVAEAAQKVTDQHQPEDHPAWPCSVCDLGALVEGLELLPQVCSEDDR
jgi:hypothetical protein